MKNFNEKQKEKNAILIYYKTETVHFGLRSTLQVMQYVMRLCKVYEPVSERLFKIST